MYGFCQISLLSLSLAVSNPLSFLMLSGYYIRNSFQRERMFGVFEPLASFSPTSSKNRLFTIS